MTRQEVIDLLEIRAQEHTQAMLKHERHSQAWYLNDGARLALYSAAIGIAESWKVEKED